MPTTDREVFARFRDDPTLTRELVHLAYAAYAEAKYDWTTLFEQREGRLPTAEETDRWIADLPDSRLDEIRDIAIAFFDDAATVYMQTQIEAAQGEAVSRSILGEVQRLNRELSSKVEAATSPRTAWRIGIGSGLLASVLFTIFVLFGAAVFQLDPSPFAVIRHVFGH